MPILDGSTYASFVIRLSQAAAQPVSVDWATASVTAVPGVDYQEASGTAQFLPGEVEKVVQVLVYGRAPGDDAPRSFRIDMLPSPNIILGQSTTDCTIEVRDVDDVVLSVVSVAQGRMGLTAYEIAVLQGFEGTAAEWLESLQGRDGDQGDEGQPGKSASRQFFDLGYLDNDSPAEMWNKLAETGADAGIEAVTPLVAAAETARDEAEIAAAAAIAATSIYASTAAGLAGTTNGEYFLVAGVDASFADRYRNDSGIATFINAYPSKAALDAALESMDATSARIDAVEAQRRTLLKSLKYRTKLSGWAMPYYRVLPDGTIMVVGGLRDDGLFFAPSGYTSEAVGDEPRRGSWGVWHVFDRNRVSAFSIMPDRKARFVAGLEAETLEVVRQQLSLGSGSIGTLIGDLPGWNHRASLLAGHITATMPTPFGPVDANVPISGEGNALALSNRPTELSTFSSQSQIYAGSKDPDDEGDVTTGGDDSDFGQILRGWRDPHRALCGQVLRYSTSASNGIAPSYVNAGGLTSIRPAGFDHEIYGIYTWLPSLVTFSRIAMDQYFQRPQTVYLEQTSSQGGTPLTEYMPGTTKGNNIAGPAGDAGMIHGAQSFMASTYDRDVILRVHVHPGNEAGPVGGDGGAHPTYASLFSAFADYVCDAGAALPANVEAGVRPVVITSQPNQPRGTVDYKTFSSGGTLGTLECALSDPDVISIGGTYDEIVADGGIHSIYKLITAEKIAYAADAWIYRGLKILPPYIDPDNAVIDGSTIILPILTNFPGPLMEDTDWLPEIPMGGIFYNDDESTRPTITSVRIVNSMSTVIGNNTITRALHAQLSGVPSGANPEIIVAGRNNNGANKWSGGLASFYVPGIPSFWHGKGLSYATPPEIRWRLCPQKAPLTRI